MKVREVIKMIEDDGWYLVAMKGSHGKKGGKIMYRFLIVIEKANGNYSAYSPDLPGCAATGKTREEVQHNMYEAIEMHVCGLREDNLPLPESHASAECVVLLPEWINTFS